MRSLLLLGFILTACSGDPKAEPKPEPEPEAPEVVDTGWPPGDLGNIHIAYHADTDKLDVFALFTESAPSFSNLAQCAIQGGTCFGAFAEDEDTFEEYDPDQDVERDTIVTRFAGFDLQIGPYKLPYREDPETKFGFYYTNGDMPDPDTDELVEPPFGETIGIKWSGEWEPYEGTEDLYVPQPVELLAPPPGTHIVFTNNETLPFEWVPTGEGLVTLSVATQFTLARMYVLEDDGYFGLNVDDLALLSDSDDLTFVLARWSQSTIRKYGHVVELLATSDVSFTGTYLQIGTRLPLDPADECAEAQGSLPLAAGGWWGYLGGAIDSDVTAPSSCIGTYPAGSSGADGIFRVNVEPKHAFSVDYNLLDASASVYFVEDCNNTSGTCLNGRDQSPDPNVHEYLQIFNPNDDPQVVYLVIDATGFGDTSVYTLDVTDDELLPPELYDTCADAQLAPYPLASDNYYSDFLSFTNNLNPGDGGCTGTSLTGAEALTRVELQSGQSLTANINMPGGDPALYLLYNCLDAFSCPIGSDVGGVSASEQLVYTNYSASPETLYLVIDSKGVGLRPYFLGVSIN